MSTSLYSSRSTAHSTIIIIHYETRTEVHTNTHATVYIRWWRIINWRKKVRMIKINITGCSEFYLGGRRVAALEHFHGHVHLLPGLVLGLVLVAAAVDCAEVAGSQLLQQLDAFSLQQRHIAFPVLLPNVVVNLLHLRRRYDIVSWAAHPKFGSSFATSASQKQLDAGQSPTFSPPGYATSRLRPANQLHFLSYPNAIYRMSPKLSSVQKYQQELVEQSHLRDQN